MNITVFGKEECGLCKTTYRKLHHHLSKWGLAEAVKLNFVKLDSEEGMAEGAFYDVLKIPTTIIEKDGELIARWEGVVPPSEEVEQKLTSH